jgi:hypothetical protein
MASCRVEEESRSRWTGRGGSHEQWRSRRIHYSRRYPGSVSLTLSDGPPTSAWIPFRHRRGPSPCSALQWSILVIGAAAGLAACGKPVDQAIRRNAPNAVHAAARSTENAKSFELTVQSSVQASNASGNLQAAAIDYLYNAPDVLKVSTQADRGRSITVFSDGKEYSSVEGGTGSFTVSSRSTNFVSGLMASLQLLTAATDIRPSGGHYVFGGSAGPPLSPGGGSATGEVDLARGFVTRIRVVITDAAGTRDSTYSFRRINDAARVQVPTGSEVVQTAPSAPPCEPGGALPPGAFACVGR